MKRPTNAVLLGPAHPYRGGLADFDHLLARALNRAGIPCRLYTFTLQYPSFLFPGKSQFTDAPAPEGLDITRVLNSVNPLNWIRTGLRIRRERPDLLIVRYWLPQMAPALGTVCRIARRGGTRTVAIMDNVLPHESRPMDRLLTRYMTGSLDGFVYMSREIRAQLDLFDRTKPSVFSPHPMYTGYGDPLPREQACGELGLDPSCRYAMFFGYIRDYKGLDLLLNAWALLRRRGGLDGRHKLIVAGEYYSGRERYAEPERRRQHHGRDQVEHGVREKVGLVAVERAVHGPQYGKGSEAEQHYGCGKALRQVASVLRALRNEPVEAARYVQPRAYDAPDGQAGYEQHGVDAVGHACDYRVHADAERSQPHGHEQHFLVLLAQAALRQASDGGAYDYGERVGYGADQRRLPLFRHENAGVSGDVHF